MSYLDELLAGDEQIKLIAHRHILFLIIRTVPYIIGTLVLWILVYIAYAQLGTGRTAAMIGLLIVSLVPLAIAIYRFMSWKLEQYAITSYRILQVEGIVNKRTFDTSLEKINDVGMTQGMGGRIFGYGDLNIITGSEIGVNKLHGIADPFAFKRMLVETKMSLSDHDRIRPMAQASTTPSPAPAAPATPPVQQAAPAATGTDAARLLAALVDLRDSGVISAAEYEQRRNQLLQQ